LHATNYTSFREDCVYTFDGSFKGCLEVGKDRWSSRRNCSFLRVNFLLMVDEHILPSSENVLYCQEVYVEERSHLHIIEHAELLKLDTFCSDALVRSRYRDVITVVEMEVAEESVRNVYARDCREEGTDALVFFF
jgi:hypothetical protein